MAAHPRATREFPKLASRRALYVAVLLHDIAKGRGGDHSVLGADVAHHLCPRFGLDEKETDLVAWLVLQHLLMSRTAQKRDLTDPKTIEDFVGEVQSLERLRNLAILTAVDIRAVGPGTWNSWKGQLLGELYDAAQERLRLGHKGNGRKARVTAKKDAVARLLGGDADHLVNSIGALLGDAYWIAEPEDIIAGNLTQYDAADAAGEALSIRCEVDETRGATRVSVIAADHPGLFYRMAGGIHLAGANIIDARIHTARSGYAVDNFLVQDHNAQPFREKGQMARIEKGIRDALLAKVELVPKLAARPLAHSRAKAFDVAPRVGFDNDASTNFTVIEVTARDRPALLNRLAHALYKAALFLVAGAWASSQLGLHALLGAYFGGAMVPPSWTKRLPVERLGQVALIGVDWGTSNLRVMRIAAGGTPGLLVVTSATMSRHGPAATPRPRVTSSARSRAACSGA